MTRSKTVHCYDKQSDDYDTYQFGVIPQYGTSLEMVAATLAEYAVPNPVIMDLGCGTGNASSVILDKMPETRMYLLDGSRRSLRAAVDKITSRAPDALVGQACADLSDTNTIWHRNIPCKFDAIISTFVLEHLPERSYRDVIRRCRSLLNPGGWLIAVESYREKEHDLISWFEKQMHQNEKEMAERILAARISGLRHREETHYFFSKNEKKAWWESYGFAHCHIVWQYLCIALMAGRKEAAED